MTVSWEDVGGEAITAELRTAASGIPVIQGIHSGDAIDLSELGAEQQYTLIATGFSSPGAEESLPPVLGQLEIEIVPDVDELGGAMLAVIGSVAQLAPMAMASEEAIEDAMQFVKMMDENVEELARAAAEAGISVGNTAFGTDPPPAGPGSSPAGPSSEGAGASPGEAAEAQPGGFLKQVGDLAGNWILLLIAVAVLAALVTLVLIVRGRAGERVTGRLKIVCEPILLDMLLQFEGRGRIKVDSPLTKHPDVARLKGGKIYDVLSHIQVSMSTANGFGMIPGSDARYLANENLITLSCSDPRTGERQTAYAGRLDFKGAVLHVSDTGRIYDVYFTSNMDLKDLAGSGRV